MFLCGQTFQYTREILPILRYPVAVAVAAVADVAAVVAAAAAAAAAAAVVVVGHNAELIVAYENA